MFMLIVIKQQPDNRSLFHKALSERGRAHEGCFYDRKFTFIVQPLLSLSSTQDQKVADDEAQIRLMGEGRCLLKFPDLECLQFLCVEFCGLVE